VAWDQVCLPKKEGGLRIKRITEWNKIALLKHIWNLCNDSDAQYGLLGSDPICCEVGISGQSRRHRIALGLGERF